MLPSAGATNDEKGLPCEQSRPIVRSFRRISVILCCNCIRRMWKLRERERKKQSQIAG